MARMLFFFLVSFFRRYSRLVLRDKAFVKFLKNDEVISSTCYRKSSSPSSSLYHGPQSCASFLIKKDEELHPH